MTSKFKAPMNSFFTKEELQDIGFRGLGENVLISRKSSIYGAEKITLGSNVRIDDFSILSGNITIKNYVHIAAFCGLYAGNAGIEIDNFVGISPNSLLFAESDDLSGEVLRGPTVPSKYRKLLSGKIILEKHSQISSGCIILPNLTIGEGSVIGATSLVTKSTEAWTKYFGSPAKKTGLRSKNALELEKELLAENSLN
jgi:acetyltransferase-like isoleucine patch superfamily enzyme